MAYCSSEDNVARQENGGSFFVKSFRVLDFKFCFEFQNLISRHCLHMICYYFI